MKLTVREVEFSYSSTPVLEGITMELAKSEVLGIVGPNGAGKSTLIRCIDGILKPQCGSILLDGIEMRNMGLMEVAKRLGYVSQSASRTFPTTVFDMVLMGRHPHAGWRCSEGDVSKVVEVIRLMDLEEFAMRDFNDLSGGQQQKVLIARALAQEPDVLLLDEPTSNLDIRHQLELMDLIKDLVRNGKISVVMAMHDLNLASRYADKVLIMKEGRIFNAGHPSDVLTPDNISSVYGVEAEVITCNGKSPYIVPIKPVPRRRGQPEVNASYNTKNEEYQRGVESSHRSPLHYLGEER
ncbi:MAG: ABC transporter ATP-binding protein [Methermicoccaceae archaeon]